MPKNGENGGKANNDASDLLSTVVSEEHLYVSTLETWLWDAACVIRGSTDAPKYKDFILPLVFYKRLSDVFDDEFRQYAKQYGSADVAHTVIRADHEDALKNDRKPIVRFYIPSEYSWHSIRNHPADGSLGEFVTHCMREVARRNPDLQGVLDLKDFNERQSGQRSLDDERLGSLVEVISRHRLGLHNAEADVFGQAYEYLLRKFAEGQGQSAGEFYTPKEVAELLARLIDAKPYSTIYDPACGSSRLLIRARLWYESQHPDAKAAAPKLYGQELNATTFAIAKMNMFIHDYTDSMLAIGDTLRNPHFASKGAGLKKFDYLVTNPMWNQDLYDEAFYEGDQWGRFEKPYPPASSADWGWIQHVVASLSETGKAAVVLDTGAVSRGSGSKSSNREKEARKRLLEMGIVEAVILLPENLFYNTTAPGIVVLIDRAKCRGARRDEVIVVNASRFFFKDKPKNVLDEVGIKSVTRVVSDWMTEDGVSRVLTLDEVRDSDYNLSPPQYVQTESRPGHRALDSIIDDIKRVALEREEADRQLDRLLATILIRRVTT